MASDSVVALPRRWRRKRDFVALADSARDAGQWRSAAQLYREALDGNPRNPAVWVQYGHALKESGALRDAEKLSRAEAAYRTALTIEPNKADTYLQLGHVLKLQGKVEEAKASYLRAFALEPALLDPLKELQGLGWSKAQLSELAMLVRAEGRDTVSADPRNGTNPLSLVNVIASETPGCEALPVGDTSKDERPIPKGSRSDRNGVKFPATDRSESNADIRRVAISLLTFAELERCMSLITQLCYFLSTKIGTLRLSVTIIVRNNNPRLDITDFQKGLAELATSHSELHLEFFNENFNVGFGSGHNRNFAAAGDCDYFLVLNDDLSFPHMDWLDEALAIFDSRPKVGAIGASNSPYSVTSFLGNGVFNRHRNWWPLRYAEASILLVRAKVFAEIGQFDGAYDWVL
jgi:hypothetical protein